ncbi:MAG: SUMF1/EgtB/PvdO family nonheme iron enzyme, partial [Opitutales bacterium]|nr:SUMF1/EgtB/PvdO family nonheme iron enzyme [Opitutales bacterium]
ELGAIALENSVFAPKSGKENCAVSFVSAYAAAMYCNWLTNGAKAQAGLADYLSGVYNFREYGIAKELFSPDNISRDTRAYRLPTLNEWYKAAYYSPELNGGAGGYYKYATQSDIAPNASAPTDSANSANYDKAVLNTTPVGSYPNSGSYYGTFDQNGNVWEWTESVVYASLDAVQLGFRGGGLYNGAGALHASDNYNIPPERGNSDFGFRVATLTVMPETSTCAIFFGAAAIVFAAWLRRKIP